MHIYKIEHNHDPSPFVRLSLIRGESYWRSASNSLERKGTRYKTQERGLKGLVINSSVESPDKLDSSL